MNGVTWFQAVFATDLSVTLIWPSLPGQGTKMDPNAKTTTIEGAVRDLEFVGTHVRTCSSREPDPSTSCCCRVTGVTRPFAGLSQ